MTTRRTLVKLWFAFASVVFALLAAATSAPAAQPVPRVTPNATCTRLLSNGSWVAVFGYTVRTQTVNIPLGQKNYISPSTVAGQPLTTFDPGTTASAFQVTVPANVASVTWVLQPAGDPLTATLTRPTGSATGTCSSSQISVFGGTWKSNLVAGGTTAVLVGTYLHHRRAKQLNATRSNRKQSNLKQSNANQASSESVDADFRSADLPVLR